MIMWYYKYVRGGDAMTRKEFRKQNKKSPKANLLEVVAAIASIISAVIELLNYFHIRP